MSLLLVDFLVQLEDKLGAADVKVEDLEGVSMHSSQVGRLEELDRSDKRCTWQSGAAGGLACAAARDLKVRPTTLAECKECDVPDQRWVCSQFVHPQIGDVGDFDDPHARMLIDARCNIGANSAGKHCWPGARDCWERRVVRVEAEVASSPGYVIDPDRPYSNRLAIRRLVREAHPCIRWYERHMPAKVLEIIAEEATDLRVTEIRLLSGDVERVPAGSGSRTRIRKDLGRIRKELAAQGVSIQWRELLADSVPHDRVFLSEAAAYNLPPLNTMLKGDTSEITQSQLTEQWFDQLWVSAAPIT